MTLDEAWAEAVAALPKKWLGPCVTPYYPKGYEVSAWHQDEVPGSGRGNRRTPAVYGETVTEALAAFTAHLKGRP